MIVANNQQKSIVAYGLWVSQFRHPCFKPFDPVVESPIHCNPSIEFSVKGLATDRLVDPDSQMFIVS
jgi:hypothetical protein